MLSFLPTSKAVPVADLVAGRHDLLLLVAIVNPFGPTVYGLDVLQRSERSRPELVSFSLNPFNVTVLTHADVARHATRGQVAHLVTTNGRDFGFLKAGPPTLIFPNGQMDDVFLQVLGHHLSRRTDLFPTLDRLRRYPLRSYDRIMEEMGDRGGTLAERGDVRPSRTSRPLTAAERTEYMSILTNTDHMRDELQSFATAWRGAIQFQADSGNADIAKSAMTWDAIVPILTAIASPKNQRR